MPLSRTIFRPWSNFREQLRQRPRTSRLLVILTLGLLGSGAYLYVAPHLWATYHWWQAERALKDYELQHAVEHLQSCLQVWPNGSGTHFLLGRTLRRQGRVTLAREHLQKANRLRYSPDALMLEFHLIEAQTGAVQAVEPILIKTYLETDHPDEFLIYEAMVSGFLLHNFFDKAYYWSSRWVQRAPNDWYPYFQRALVLERGSNRQKAMEDYRRVLDLKPDQVDARVRLADILRQESQVKRYDEALELYQSCLTYRPGYRAAILGIGLCYRAKGDMPAARENLQAVLPAPDAAQSRDDAEAVMALGQLAMDEDQPAKALPWFRKAVVLAPANSEAHRHLAEALRTSGQGPEAKSEEDRFQQLDKAYAHVETIRRELHQLRAESDDETAKTLFLKKASDLRCQAGKTLMSIGQEEEAVGWLISATQLNPGNDEARKALTDYHNEKGPMRDKFKSK